VLENDKKWSSQIVKSLQIVVFNKVTNLVTLTSALRALVNKILYLFGKQNTYVHASNNYSRK